VRRREKAPTVLTAAEASAALATAEELVARWSGEAQEKTRTAERLAVELAEAEALAGEEAVGDEDDDTFEDDAQLAARISTVTDALARARLEQDVAAKAAQVAAERLDGACRAALQARAEALRARVAELRATAAVRQARTGQLLAELERFERTGYAVAPRSTFDGQTVPGTWTLTRQIMGRADWLAGQADEVVRVAVNGSPDEVRSALARPMPEILEVERYALDAAEPVAA
jgi:hypothetical protein